MYKGFSMAKYKRIMGKLNLNTPTHTANFAFTVTEGDKVWGINLSNVPVMFEIISVNTSTYGSLKAYVTRRYQLIVHRDYFKDKVLTANDGRTIPLRIEKIVAGKDNWGYDNRVTINRNVSQIEDNDGYMIPYFTINYGDYADGGYRQYLELSHVSTLVYA